MLLNKFFIGLILVSEILFVSCGDKKEENKNKAPLKDFKDQSVQLSEAKKLLGNNVKITFVGNFGINKEELIAGSETKDEWGIKFTSIDINGELKKIFETDLLEGSFEKSKVEKLKLPSKNYELIYYNSRDYLIGPGGGEVFAYIIDFTEREVFYAHLVADNKKVSLYLSENINNDDIRKFFKSSFKRDFPSYSLISQDIEYDQ